MKLKNIKNLRIRNKVYNTELSKREFKHFKNNAIYNSKISNYIYNEINEKIKKIIGSKKKGYINKQDNSIKIYKFLNLPLFEQFYVNLYNSHKIHNRSKVSLIDHCVFTNRTKIMYHRLKISRIKLKDLIKMKLIPGYNKAIW